MVLISVKCLFMHFNGCHVYIFYIQLFQKKIKIQINFWRNTFYKERVHVYMCGFLTSSILIDEVNNYTGMLLRIACFDLNCPLFTCLDFWHRLSSISVDIKILSPVVVCPWPAAIYLYKIWKKNCMKSDFKEIFLKLATNDLDVPVDHKISPSRGCQPVPGAIYMYKIMKKMYKIRLKFSFLKLVANGQSDKRFLLTSKFCSQGLSAPDLRLYIFIEVEAILFKLATNDHSDEAFLLI